MSTPSPIARGFATLLVLIVATAATLAVVVLLPLGRGPDEHDHLDYTNHLLIDRRLPDPRTEAIGQIQHPPLPYAAEAAIWHGLDRLNETIDESTFRDRDFSRILGRKTLFDPARESWRIVFPSATSRPVTGDRIKDLHLQSRQWEVYGLRLISVLLGLWTFLALRGAITRLLADAPGERTLALAVVALTPQWAFLFATVSNDAWIVWIGAIAGAIVLRAVADGSIASLRTRLWISFWLALGFLTKLHVIGILIFAVVAVFRHAAPGRSLGERIQKVVPLAIFPVLLAAWWHIRQIALMGSLLARQNHVDFRPSLLRLDAFHPIIVVDFFESIAKSFFGVLGADTIETHGLYYIGAAAVAFAAIAGALFCRRPPAIPSAESGAAPVRLGAAVLPEALFGVLALLVALNISNAGYYHALGRYLWTVLVPLVVILIEGLTRLLGERRGTALRVAAVWNAVFLITAVLVCRNRYSIDVEKIDRGHVVAYLDSGNPDFDQKTSGSPSNRRFSLLNLPEYTARYDIQVFKDPKMRYRFPVPDKSKRYQIRVRYPAMQGMDGDVPHPTANVMLLNSWIVHGPQSFWTSFGELRFPVPEPALQGDTAEIWWENHAPDAAHAAVAEIWFEEAWVSVVGTPELVLDGGGRVVNVTLTNIDERESHRADLFLAADRRAFGAYEDLILGPGEKRTVTIPLNGEPPLDRLTVHVVDAGASAWANMKIAPWAEPDVRRGGDIGVPDVTVLKPVREPGRHQRLARVKLPRQFDGEWKLGISHPADEDPLTKGIIDVAIDGAKLEDETFRTDAGYGKNLALSLRRFKKTAPGENDLWVTISLTGSGPAGPVILDRLFVFAVSGPTTPGHDYRVLAPKK